jgi:carboxymethylenebutenolidase
MTENPYVLATSCGTGRIGVHDFYANQFLPNIPPDLEFTSLSQTFGQDRLLEEMVMRFTHSIEMDWIFPASQPRVEVSSSPWWASFSFKRIR